MQQQADAAFEICNAKMNRHESFEKCICDEL